MQSYFAVTKNISLNSMLYFIMKISNKQELQQTAFNHSSKIYFKDFMRTFDSHRLLLNLADKMDLRRSHKYLDVSNISTYYTRKKIKSDIITINLKYQF